MKTKMQKRGISLLFLHFVENDLFKLERLRRSSLLMSIHWTSNLLNLITQNSGLDLDYRKIPSLPDFFGGPLTCKRKSSVQRFVKFTM